MCLLLQQPCILLSYLVLALASRAGPTTFPGTLTDGISGFFFFKSNKDLEGDEKELECNSPSGKSRGSHHSLSSLWTGWPAPSSTGPFPADLYQLDWKLIKLRYPGTTCLLSSLVNFPVTLCSTDDEHQTQGEEPGLVSFSFPCSSHLLLSGVPPVQGKSLSVTCRADGRAEKGQ